VKKKNSLTIIILVSKKQWVNIIAGRRRKANSRKYNSFRRSMRKW
jgi:hypothetical protein